jgi:hypothetical protein
VTLAGWAGLPVAELVAERLRTEGRIFGQAVAVRGVYRRLCESAHMSDVRCLVSTLKTVWRGGHHRGGRPAVWSPDDHLVIDWSSVGGLHVSCTVSA